MLEDAGPSHASHGWGPPRQSKQMLQLLRRTVRIFPSLARPARYSSTMSSSSSSNNVYTARWGILATGFIAEKFAKDLLIAPSTRSVSDVQHEIVAVASSSSASRAADFIKQIGHGAPDKCAAYASYEELVADPNVDIVYVATPHAFHYDNTLLALEAGKHVCCEKPFTINARQARHLIKVAKAHNRFLMEAVWTRFFPITLEIQRLLHKERILGKISRVFSDLSICFDPDPKHRLYNPDLGGGALLDLGLYPLTWQMITLFQDPDNKRTAPEITSSVIKTPLTGVDEFTTVVMNFGALHAQGIATCSMSARTSGAYCVNVQGEKGELAVEWAPFRPVAFSVRMKDADGSPGAPERTEFEIPGGGHGMFWEADACARALRGGKTEAELCPLDESVLVMEIMDKVRKDADFSYPQKLEAVRSDA